MVADRGDMYIDDVPHCTESGVELSEIHTISDDPRVPLTNVRDTRTHSPQLLPRRLSSTVVEFLVRVKEVASSIPDQY